jgi:hypothetical protein
MSLREPLERILGHGLENYNPTKFEEICGVKIRFKPSERHDSTSWNDWRDTLEEWLPKFKQAGWLDGLIKIRIADDAARGDAVGQYFNSGEIALENNIDLGVMSGNVLECSPEFVFTHEMIHHAHMNLNGKSNSHQNFDQSDIRSQVSWYAGMDNLEAVAEIGAGIIHGYEFPDRIHEFYEEDDGPMAVYDDIWQNDTTN